MKNEFYIASVINVNEYLSGGQVVAEGLEASKPHTHCQCRTVRYAMRPRILTEKSLLISQLIPLGPVYLRSGSICY